MEEGEAADGMYFVGVIDEVRLSVMTAGTPARGEAGTLGLVAVNYVYNARNQLVTETSGASVRIYSYDPNGNVRFITETVGGVEASVEEMTYDELNRMLTHTGPKGTETFTYRGAEWHRASANGTQFLYDGDDVLADIGTGGVEALYVTPSLDQNLSITKDGSTYYYSQDGLGSVRTLTDAAGVVVNRYDYLPFGGGHQPGTSATVDQRYTYTGRERNPTSDLMYYRWRQYDPRVGRLGRRDPIGYRQGPHLYSYAWQNPVRRRDSHGLLACPAAMSVSKNVLDAMENAWSRSGHRTSEDAEHSANISGSEIATAMAGEIIRGEHGHVGVSIADAENPAFSGRFHTHPRSEEELAAMNEPQRRVYGTGGPHSFDDMYWQARFPDWKYGFVYEECCTFLAYKVVNRLPGATLVNRRIEQEYEQWADENGRLRIESLRDHSMAEAAAIADLCGLCYYKSCGEDRGKGIFVLVRSRVVDEEARQREARRSAVQ